MKNVIASHLDKKSLVNLKLASKTMNRTTNVLPAARAATTVKNAAAETISEINEIQGIYKGLMADHKRTIKATATPAARLQATRQMLNHVVDVQGDMKNLREEKKSLQGVIKKADAQKKKNM